MFLTDLLQELVSLLGLDTAAFLTVFSLLVQHCQQEAASTKMVSPKFQSPLFSLSKLMDVNTSLESCLVAHLLVLFDHWLADPGWLAGRGGHQPLLPGWASYFSLFPLEDPAMADQFLKRENWFAMAGSSIRKRVGEEEEAQEENGCRLCPAIQPGSANQWSNETRRWATATGRDPKLVFTHIHQHKQRQQQRL